MAIGSEFLKHLMGGKKQKFYRKHEVAKHNLEEIKRRGILEGLKSDRQDGSIVQEPEITSSLFRLPKPMISSLLFLSFLIAIFIVILMLAFFWGLTEGLVSPDSSSLSEYVVNESVKACVSDDDCSDVIEYRCREDNAYRYFTMFICVDQKCVKKDTSRALMDTCGQNELCVHGKETCQPKPTLTLALPWLEELSNCRLIEDQIQRDDCYSKIAISQKDSIICDMIKTLSIKYGCYNELSKSSSPKNQPESVKTTEPEKTPGKDDLKIKCGRRDDCPEDIIDYVCDSDDNVIKNTRKFYCAIYSGSYCMSRDTSKLVDKCESDEICVEGMDQCQSI